MTLYKLQHRRYIGASIGYFKWETIETFEDLQLALKEEDLLRKRLSIATRIEEVET